MYPKKMKYIIAILLICFYGNFAFGETPVDSVIVKKSEKKMYLYQRGKILKEYRVSFGANPKGHKQQEGDERTPEGIYLLDFKKSDSSFYKAIHISYPNQADIENARKKNVSPGGQIMIHGQKNGFGSLSFIAQRFNWTDGCIAVTNKEMDEIWKLVEVNTPISIEK
jgi:murein L,D-transpeptidase YafK